MRQQQAGDHLDLWRGIDDAIWREAMRALPAPAARIAMPPMQTLSADRAPALAVKAVKAA
jgi:hypothetical protein